MKNNYFVMYITCTYCNKFPLGIKIRNFVHAEFRKVVRADLPPWHAGPQKDLFSCFGPITLAVLLDVCPSPRLLGPVLQLFRCLSVMASFVSLQRPCFADPLI